MSTHDGKSGSTASLKHKFKKNEDNTETNETTIEDEGLLEHPSYQELQAKLTEAEEKAAQYWDRAVRTQAEIENIQRRAERDLANAHKYAIEKFTLELLPIVDTFERAVNTHESEESGSGTLLDGTKMTLNMIYAAFEKFGIQQVNPEKQPFNPELHQAVSTQADSDVKPGTVIAVLQKGYLLNNRLIRPALVVVSKA